VALNGRNIQEVGGKKASARRYELNVGHTGSRGISTDFWWGNSKESVHFEEERLEWRMILKGI
jgi:hypothetical protein